LPCKWIIHTVGPIWQGGAHGEKDLLISCYKNSLMLAKEHGCQTVAFPLISSGVYGYPKDQALSVAISTISEFLFENEMAVYLTIFDKTAFQISEKLFADVKAYIDDNYAAARSDARFLRRRREAIFQSQRLDEFPTEYENLELCNELSDYSTSAPSFELSLADMLSDMDDNFTVTLLKLIDLKGISDVECYKRANVSKQTWYKIMNEKDYRPSKTTVISFAIALQLTLEETKSLLATVGFTLSKSSKFDIIIEYFLRRGEYNVFTINETLFQFDQVCLGV
jgi:hypothetical protein